MKTKKNFADWLGLITVSISIIGFAAFFISMMIDFFFLHGASNTILNSTGIIGAFAFMLPFFLLQFALPSGLLDRFGFQTDIPFWGKVVFYVVLFPFANMWMLSVIDTTFHFLPNYHLAMSQGYSLVIVEAMREQSISMGWAIIGVTYASMISMGLLFRGIFGNKLKAKIA
jgi:hypothetical protein